MEYSYDDSLNLTRRELFKRSGQSEWKFLFYYNAKGQKTKTERYSKGKLKKVYQYDCGIYASLSEKTKDTSTSCTNVDTSADGYIRTIEETKTENGKILKTVKENDPKTGSYREFRYNSKGNLMSLVSFEYSGNTFTSSYKSFKRNGKNHYSSQGVYVKPGLSIRNFLMLNDEKIEDFSIFCQG